MPSLLVRLPNWIGDTVMTLPALAALSEAGFKLQLLGKGWARPLLGGLPYEVHAYPSGLLKRSALLRQLASENNKHTPGKTPLLLLTNSLSSALEARAAGLPATGYRHEGRGPLLTHALVQDRSLHQLERYWLLAQSMAAMAPNPKALAGPVPRQMHLALTNEAMKLARERVARLNAPFVLLCPFGAGTIKGVSKLWTGFADLIRTARLNPRTATLQWVVCPGKGETPDPALQALLDEEQAAGAHAVPDKKTAQPQSRLHVFDNVALPEYAALMKLSACTVGNDSGPSHMAAAVGAKQVTVFGPSDPADTSPWHPQAVYLGGRGHWPGVDEVMAALLKAL